MAIKVDRAQARDQKYLEETEGMTGKAHSKRIEIKKIKIGDTVMSTEQ